MSFERLPPFVVVEGPPDALMGRTRLSPVLDAAGVEVDHVVTHVEGVGSSLFFGDPGRLAGRLVSQLDGPMAVLLRELLDRRAGRSVAVFDVVVLERRARFLGITAPDGTVDLMFTRIDTDVDSTDSPATHDSVRIRRLWTMLSSLPDGLAMYEPVIGGSGEIEDFRCLEITEVDPVLPANEQIGRRILELFPEIVRNGLFDGYREVMRSGQPWTAPPVVYERDEQQYEFRVRAVAVDGHLVISWRDLLVDREPRANGGTGRPLTARQVDILRAISEGASTAEIATREFLSPYTVRNEVRRILAKFGVGTRAEAVAVGYSLGILVARPDRT